MNKKIAVLIPIKEHSERIPNKNFKLVNKNPLHNLLIKKLEKADFISKIYINTDSYKIFEYYKNNPKVKLINRKKELIGDFISMNDIISSSFDGIEENIILQTHTTNPLVLLSTFKQAYLTYLKKIKEEYDSLISVNKYYKRFYNKNFKAINHNPKILLRTQDLKPLLVENSCIYIFSKDSFKTSGSRIGNNPFLFEMNEYEAIDVDWPEDLNVVKNLFNKNLIK